MRIFAVGTKIYGEPGQHLGGGAVPPPGPNVEPPLRVRRFFVIQEYLVRSRGRRRCIKECATAVAQVTWSAPQCNVPLSAA